jgi:ATP-binding cassette subfamily B protein
MVMKAARGVVLLSLAARLLAGLLPLGMLAITRFIIDSINPMGTRHQPLPGIFWWMLLLEFGLATLGMTLGRVMDFCDAVFADKYATYINARTIDHASRLDLATYEDSAFHDKLERARIQGTERIGMIQAAGKLMQQFVTAISLVAGNGLSARGGREPRKCEGAEAVSASSVSD